MSSSIALPPISPQANKYTRGKLTAFVGSSRYTGAAVLAAKAAERMGAGYTEVLTAPEAVPIVRMASASLVVGEVSPDAPASLPATKKDRPCAVLIGSGFQGTKAEKKLLLAVLKQARCPVLVDGGALAFLGKKKVRKALAARKRMQLPTVVTPHMGEAARIAGDLGVKLDESPRGAGMLARGLHSIVVLKGPDTYISDGEAAVTMAEGTAALAKAGTGDVLAGMIASLLAQGIEPMLAAYAGAMAHARAGRLASRKLNMRSVTAEDVIEALPYAID